MAGYRVAVVGATGLVGEKVLRLLEERNFPVSDLVPMASERSAGKTVRFRDTDITVRPLAVDEFKGIDFAFFAAGTDINKQWAPEAVRLGAVVVDKSNAFRMDPRVPLVVPEVNPEALERHEGIIASPNCSTIQLVMALHPLRKLGKMQRVIISTYQAVSGTGTDAMHELEQQVAGDLTSRVYPKQIAFNVLPQCDSFEDNGYTKEEMKLVNETRKILNEPDLLISATAVRVPVRVGHSESVLVEFDQPVDPESVRETLSQAPGVKVVDDPGIAGGYPTALDAAENDLVLVGRVRRDLSSPRGIWLWIVADNLRKGAATNAVQIAEHLATLIG